MVQLIVILTVDFDQANLASTFVNFGQRQIWMLQTLKGAYLQFETAGVFILHRLRMHTAYIALDFLLFLSIPRHAVSKATK